jgi:hypothetical protein
VKEQRSPGAGARLGQHLRREHPEREPGVDDVVRQAVRGKAAALEDRAEADLFGVPDAVRELGEGPALVEIGRVNDVSGRAELLDEGEAPGRFRDSRRAAARIRSRSRPSLYSIF